MANDKESRTVVNFLQWRFQKEWNDNLSTFGWCSEMIDRNVDHLEDPFFFYVVEPLIFGNSLVCVAELGYIESLVADGPPPLPISESELGHVASDLAIDVMYRDRENLEKISAMFAANLFNFSSFRTANQLLKSPRYDGEKRSGGIIHYLSSGDVGAQRTSRPCAWNAPSLLTPFEVLESCVPYVIKDNEDHPQRYSTFPVKEFIERLAAAADGSQPF